MGAEEVAVEDVVDEDRHGSYGFMEPLLNGSRRLACGSGRSCGI